MTDRLKYTDRHDDQLYLYSDPIGEDILGVYAPRTVTVPAGELLAMIDRIAPDAMRAYFREAAPEVIADLYRPETPEADFPEDVDERPDVEQARAAGEQLGKMMRAFGDAYAEAMQR